MSRAIKNRLDKLEALFHAEMKPISEWRPGMNAEYLGVSTDTKVDIHTLLNLEHNAIIHHAFQCEYGTKQECISRMIPVEGIPQRWDDMTINQ